MGTPLRESFPELFSIVSSKNAWVIDVWDKGSWNPRFGRQLHDWKLEEVDVFFGRLYEYSVSMEIEDIMV